MTIQEAINSKKPFRLKGSDIVTQWFEGGTGPHSNLVDCDYFVSEGIFSTSIDLYASQVTSKCWEIVKENESVTNA